MQWIQNLTNKDANKQFSRLVARKMPASLDMVYGQ